MLRYYAMDDSVDVEQDGPLSVGEQQGQESEWLCLPVSLHVLTWQHK